MISFPPASVIYHEVKQNLDSDVARFRALLRMRLADLAKPNNYNGNRGQYVVKVPYKRALLDKLNPTMQELKGYGYEIWFEDMTPDEQTSRAIVEMNLDDDLWVFVSCEVK